MRIAVNFPYFVPYSGYFRLFATTDLFVIFDCVPFPRRGYVHRNQLPNEQGNADWLTLPLKKAPRDTAIKDMFFVDDIFSEFQSAMRRFPDLNTPLAEDNLLLEQCRFKDDIHTPDLVDYLENTLRVATRLLDIPFNVVRSSSLPIDPELRGEARVLSIVKHLGGTHYVNAPGGRHLYDSNTFRRNGIELDYLEFFRGNHWSILHRLLNEDADIIRHDIYQQCS